MTSKRDEPKRTATPSRTPHRPHTFVAALLTILLATPNGVSPDGILVNDECTLPDAMTSVLGATPAGGCEVQDSAPSGETVIEITADVDLTSVNNETDGPNGLPSVTGPVRVEGNGFTVRRASSFFRIFHIASNGTLTLNDLSVENGDFSYYSSSDGGGIFVASGGKLLMTGGALRDNAAGNQFGMGGGVFANGIAEFNGTLITENGASEGGGIGSAGGSVTLIDSTVSNNSRRGIHQVGGSVTLINTTLSGNFDGDQFTPGGGAIFSTFGSLTVINSTFSNNTGSYGPSTIEVEGGTASITNSTFMGNQAATGKDATLSSSHPDSEITLWNTIVADTGQGSNCGGGFTAGGNNFDDDGSCPGASPIEPAVDISTQLRGNGGPTQTHALLPGSVAIDGAGECESEADQRSYARVGRGCDSGAYEFEGMSPIVISAAGSCPGTIELTILGATPLAEVGIASSPNEGSDLITGGPCDGTRIWLDSPLFRSSRIADASGSSTIQIEVGPARCGDVLQAVDFSTCAVSAAARFRIGLGRTAREFDHRHCGSSGRGCGLVGVPSIRTPQPVSARR